VSAAEIPPSVHAGGQAASPGHEALLSYIEHFQKRVVEDAIVEASAGYWRGRAAPF
jgi:hypothetical protein